ncbi:hypothetical protein CPB83DRAFT_167322 [Crepidotus variabilis]|uniref:SGNH hydrolase-type esterase domain-containing protein n=1 Tax=Crepidotus variabilis TaxID=179855 RepID=A0A9P6EJ01_9AGAR|nr:hypothetical protein CPB83DRAFT_167322 [Crepidotus variabilis]
MKYFSPDKIPPSRWKGRWAPSTSQNGTTSMKTAWSSASASFLFSGRKLSLRAGASTERKDKDNGGTPMLAILTGLTERAALNRDPNLSTWRTVDPAPNTEIIIFDDSAKGQDGVIHDKTFVKIVLIDWASIFDFGALITDDDGDLDFEEIKYTSVPKVLLIGDSISCAMAVSPEQGGEPIPFGILEGYPYVAQRILLERNLAFDLELVAHPGINMVKPTEEEKEKGQPIGMEDLFFWKSFWEREESKPNVQVTIVAIALGTNDQFFKITPERFYEAIVNLIQRLIQLSTSPIQQVWLIPPFPDADTDSQYLSEAIPSFTPLLVKKFQDQHISFKLCDLVKGLTAKDTVDGVHPSLITHQRLGRDFALFIEKEVELNLFL